MKLARDKTAGLDRAAPEAEWRRWRPRDSGWWLGVVGAIGLYVQLAVWRYIPDPFGLSQRDTWLLFALPLLGAAIVAMFSLAWWCGKVALERIRWYPRLYTEATALRRQIETRADQLTDQEARIIQLGRHLAAYVQLLERHERSFRILGAARVEGRVVLLLERKRQPPIRAADRLLVMDPRSGELLGLFSLAKIEARTYFVAEETIWGALWWGHAHDCADRHSQFQTEAVAFLMPRED